MKVLLMAPMTCFVESPPFLPDLGLGYLASALEQEGHKVFIRSWNMEPSVHDFRRWLETHRPEVVGIKVFTKDVKATQETISIVKSFDSRITVIVGGPHPSAVEPGEIMEDFPSCDFAFQGEAEVGLPLLLKRLSCLKSNESTRELSAEGIGNVPGLVWQEKGSIHNNPQIFVRDLDSLGHPSWSLMNPKEYAAPPVWGKTRSGHTALIAVTRGCPGNCIFCSAHHVSGKKVRSRTANHVVEEIEHLYDEYGVRQLTISDNCFTHDRELLKQTCQLLIDKRLDLVWDCVSYQRLDNLDEDTLPLMKEAGCIMIHMGVECGSPRVRQTLRKGGSLEEIKEKVSLIKRCGMDVLAFFMLGFPGETKDDMRKTINFAYSLDTRNIVFEICFPLPGTEAYRFMKKKYRLEKVNWASFQIKRSPYPLSELPSKMVSRLVRWQRAQTILRAKTIRFSPTRFHRRPRANGT